MIDRNARDEAQRVLNEQYDLAEDERRAAERKHFSHREILSKCPTCRFNRCVMGRQVCMASGKTIKDDTGTGACAYFPIEVPNADE